MALFWRRQQLAAEHRRSLFLSRAGLITADRGCGSGGHKSNRKLRDVQCARLDVPRPTAAAAKMRLAHVAERHRGAGGVLGGSSWWATHRRDIDSLTATVATQALPKPGQWHIIRKRLDADFTCGATTVTGDKKSVELFRSHISNRQHTGLWLALAGHSAGGAIKGLRPGYNC
jgi:hypothetical protein